MLISRIYINAKILGPYFANDNGRWYIHIHQNGKYLQSMNLARFRMQEYIGRLLLDEEHVDHIDDNKQNDKIGNLQILTQAENNEKSQRKYEKEVTEICFHCNEPFIMTSVKQILWEFKRKNNQFGPFCTASCAAKFNYTNRR